MGRRIIRKPSNALTATSSVKQRSRGSRTSTSIDKNSETTRKILEGERQASCTACGASIWKTGSSTWLTWTAEPCCASPTPGPPGWMWDPKYAAKMREKALTPPKPKRKIKRVKR